MDYTTKGPDRFILYSDSDFRLLSLPIKKERSDLLARQIIKDPNDYPVAVWRGYVIAGYDKYETCVNRNLPFVIHEYGFNTKDEAIVWTCKYYLKQEQLSEEGKRFLIGLQYEAEKKVSANLKHRQKEITDYDETPIRFSNIPSDHKTARRIADDYYISWTTVCKYSTYSSLVLKIGEKVPEAMAIILSGRYVLSFNSLKTMSELNPERIRTIIYRLEMETYCTPRYKSRKQRVWNDSYGDEEKITIPDSNTVEERVYTQMNALIQTVQMWVDYVEQLKNRPGLNSMDHETKFDLINCLADLIRSTESLISALKNE